MIKFLTAILLSVALSQTCQAQIQVKKPVNKFNVGEVKQTGTLLYGIIGETNDTTYVLMYRNAEYQTLVDFKTVHFGNQDSTLTEFYKILKSVFLDENIKNRDYRVEFKLGDEDVSVSTYRIMGVTSVRFYTQKGYCYLTEKQIDKLFGKD